MIRFFIYLTAFVLVNSCTNDIKIVRENYWKYSGGECYFADMIHFESDIFKIMDDNHIYYNGHFIGKLVSVDSEYITIECPDGKTAEFIKFGEAKR